MKKIILVLSVLFSTHVMAYQVTTTTVASINVNPSSVVVGLKDSHTNDDSCSHALSAKVLVLPLTTNTKAMYSALLSAQISGKTARLLYDGCLASLPQIIRVDILTK